ncbi:MAG: 5,10-methylenetetrahydrofolate reductase [Caldiserica bacterium]|nr:MAG: 5,10-methylenetetrahydrofolate reductase [Caldisericota bacterium]
MKITEIFKKKGFLLTCEIGPPKGYKMDSVIEKILDLKDFIDAFNVTDFQGSTMRMSSPFASYILKKNGFEVIMQLTTRDRNRIALQGDLLGAFSLGIENVLALTGDPPSVGDHPEAKPVFDIGSSELISVIKKLNEGYDMMGNRLEEKTDFCIGCAANPCVENIDEEFGKLEKKIKAGAEFIQTQAVYEVERFSKFIEKFRKNFGNIPVLVGIVFIKSAKMAKYMNENIPGIFVPEYLIKEISKFDSEEIKERKRKAAKIMEKIVIELKETPIDGFHFMPLGWYESVRYLFESLKEEKVF